MEPAELVVAAVRLQASSVSGGPASAAHMHLGDVITQGLVRTSDGAQALAALRAAGPAGHPDPTDPADAPGAVVRLLLDEVLTDPEFARRLYEAVAYALPAEDQLPPVGGPGGTHGTRSKGRRGGPAHGAATLTHLRTSQAAGIVLVLALAVAAVLGFRANGEERASAPLDDPAQVRTVVPDQGSVPSDWTVTEQIQAERCSGEPGCVRLLGSAEAGWKDAELVVYAAMSEEAAAELYRDELRGPLAREHTEPTEIDAFGDECTGWRRGGTHAVLARSGTVVVLVAGTGAGARAQIEQLARVTIARADQAQRGRTPTASMRDSP